MQNLLIEVAQNHMSTTFRFHLSCPKSDQSRAERLLMECHRLVHQIETEISEYLESSWVYQLNHSRRGELITLPERGVRLYQKSRRLQILSKNSFDPTFKSPQLYIDPFVLDESNATLRKNFDDVHLGFGAIGKGFALDEVRVLLEQNGFQHYLLSAGGSSTLLSGFASGNEIDPQPWTWAWNWKYDKRGGSRGKVFTHHSGQPLALGTSGTQDRGAHILSRDQQIQSQSALVISNEAATADALSTSLFILGFEVAIDLFQESHDCLALAEVDRKDVPRWNGSFQELVGQGLTEEYDER